MTDHTHRSRADALGRTGASRLIGRPFGGRADLPALEALLATCAAPEHPAYTQSRLQGGPSSAPPTAPSVPNCLWRDAAAPDGPLVACAFGGLNATFHIHPAARVPAVETVVMRWIDGQVAAQASAAIPRVDVQLRAGDDEYRAALLERRGFTRQESVTLRLRRSFDEPIPEPVLPTGHRIRPLRGEGELDTFLALFDEAYGVRPTSERRAQLWRRPAHVPELVVEATDGPLVAFCYVDVGALSMMPLEPGEGCVAQFGCARGYPYQVFARAAFRAGLRELRRRGMTAARVQAGSRNEKELLLFAAEGFQPTEIVPRLRYTKAAAPPAADPPDTSGPTRSAAEPGTP
jgi:hypothetical protein